MSKTHALGEWTTDLPTEPGQYLTCTAFGNVSTVKVYLDENDSLTCRCACGDADWYAPENWNVSWWCRIHCIPPTEEQLKSTRKQENGK